MTADAPFAIYKITDVAAKLGKSKRWLEDFLRQNPRGRRASRNAFLRTKIWPGWSPCYRAMI
jgi:hypothetical protein